MASYTRGEWIVKRFILIFLLITSTCFAKEIRVFTYDQLADAIYNAEGGEKATYLYGIRSVSYEDEEEARRICINTIRNNIRRYKEYGHKHHPNYLSFLASRYCPVTGKNLSSSERKLNKHWLGNVKYFLNKQYENRKSKTKR